MASSISEAQAELINSLGPDDVPMKLRCAICNKLAVDAFRLPCCEQATCGTCHASLASSCPVCEHSPLSAEDCNPNKSLRTTIKVFLRTTEKKRETLRAREAKNSAPPTPVEASKPQEPPADAAALDASVAQGEGQPQESISVSVKEEQSENGVPQAPEQADQTGDDNEQANPNPSALIQRVDDEEVQDQGADQADEQGANDGEGEGEGEGEEAAGDDQQNFNSESTNDGFASMNYQGGGDFNQMQMMMAMQNGMGSNSFGNFPMMGNMSGMSMDPMMMQNMYMNGGFQGMGMNGMGGFGGGFGQGTSNNWNGTQSWNFDQNNYNQNGPVMGTGDFGNFNSGFQQTGYNQGNYGHQFNDYRRGGFGRGRGRGRGFYASGGYGYGRGGFQQQQYHHQQQQQQQYGPNASFSQHQQGQQNPQGQLNTGEENPQQSGDEYGRDVRPHGENEGQGASDSAATALAGGEEDGPSQEGGVNSEVGNQDHNALASGEALDNESAGASTEAPNGAGAIRSVLSIPDVPINAPTGPKAMRQGLPNTSLHNLRARGYQVGQQQARPQSSSQHSQQHQASPGPERPRSRSKSPQRERDHESERGGGDRDQRDHDHDREQSRERSSGHDRRDRDDNDERERGRDPDRPNSVSASKSRSRSRGHKSSRRRRRHRSASANEDYENDSYRRKKHRSSRKYDDDTEYSSRGRDEKYPDERSRSASPDESKRSGGHKNNRRERDYDKRRDRDKDKYRDEDRKKSTHRSHRDRDYEHSRRRDRDRDRKDRKDRERTRDRDSDRDYRQNNSKRGSTEELSTPIEGKPPRSFDIRGTGSRGGEDSSRRGSQASTVGGGKGHPTKDVHTLEREARDRERLLKEAQRLTRIGGLAGSKRSRDDGDGDGGGRKSRRASRRSETVDGGDEEERMRRLEAEREGGRWG